MIDFRYHIVSLTAVFLALALGLFLGSTTLQSSVTHSLTSQANRLTSDNQRLRSQKSALGSQVQSEQGLIAAAEPYAVSGQLAGQTVALVTAPGVSGKTHDALLATLGEAGASVTADVALQPSFLDPTQDTELGTLATEIAPPGESLPSGNGAIRASAVLADVLVSRAGQATPSHGRIVRALNVLEVGKFVDVSGTPPSQPADLSVLLVPAASTSIAANAAAAQNAVLVGLTRDLRGSSVATVLAGPRPTGNSDLGALTAARADANLVKTVSTVNLDDGSALASPPSGSLTGEDPAAGRIAIVLALVAEQSQTFGSYGLGYGATAPLPSPSASP